MSRILPKISIVVPNFNGAATLGATLESLISQEYPDLEIVVADGGSTDNSVEIIRRFESHIVWWCSEKDSGQSDAINKGLAHCTGEVLNWLGSDDVFTPGALLRVGECFSADPSVDVVVGKTRVIHTHGEKPDFAYNATDEQIALMPCINPVPQPSCFFKRRLLDRAQPVDESYHYCMDFELWMHFKSRGAKWKIIDDVLADFAMTGDNKTSTGKVKIGQEMERIYRAYTHERISLAFWYRQFALPLALFRERHRGGMLYYPARVIEKSFGVALWPFYGKRWVRALDWQIYFSP